MSLKIEELRIPGLYSIQPKVLGDSRGLFLETYSERLWEGSGLKARFVQDNLSVSHKGVLRGLHYQRMKPQGKLVWLVSGEAFDVAVDLRKGSPTFGRWEGVILSGKKTNQIYISPGFAHGFLVLSAEAVCAYKCTEFYDPEDEGGLRWNDPALGIAWPDIGQPPQLSAKDLSLPFFDPAAGYFPMPGSLL